MSITVVNIRGEVKKNGSIVTKADLSDGYAEAPDIEGLVENKGLSEDKELSRDEMKKIADDNNLEYPPNIKSNKLKELVKEYI